MNSSGLRRSLVASVLAAAALGLPAVPAQAVIYGSTFDPPDFFGVAIFDVTQACLSVGTGFADPSLGVPAGCEVTWLSASVTFPDPDPAAPDNTEVVNYGAFLPSSSVVNEIFVDAGELAGVRSSVIGPVVVSGNPEGSFNGPWWIQYVFSLEGPNSGSIGLGRVNLFGGECSSVRCFIVGPPETADVLTFTRITQVVPEPGSLALLLGALGGAWGVRRRKTAPG